MQPIGREDSELSTYMFRIYVALALQILSLKMIVGIPYVQ
jgi:hypothetical protein